MSALFLLKFIKRRIKMKKTVFLWMFALLCMWDKPVQAADSKADAIMNETKKAMNQVKVYGISMIVDGQLFIEMEMDNNTGIIYMNTLEGGKIWVDKNANIFYTYDPEASKYYYMPMDGEDLQVTENMENTMEFEDAYMVTYVGEEVYTVKNEKVECYKLLVTDPADPTIPAYYYIKKDSYLLCGAEYVQSSETVKIQYYYPEAVTIPQEVKEKAIISPGYTITKNKIDYTVLYEKNTPVVYVCEAKKAKGKVKIPETVKIDGTQYKVTGILDQAFKNNKKITAVTIGKNVSSIGREAFYNCKKLKMVTIKSMNLKRIGKKAFYKNANTLTFKVPKKKASKYEKMIQKSKCTSNIQIKKQ